MEKIALFYHVYQTKNWETLVQEQLETIKLSDLWQKAAYKHAGINGSKPFLYDFNSIVYNEYQESEIDTLLSLYKFCLEFPKYKVLYLHTKGVSIPPSPRATNAHLWRKYLEYFNIQHWRKCIKYLDEYDCVGTEWQLVTGLTRPKPVPPHYSGNFWWANAEYINTLDIDFLKDTKDQTPPLTLRHQCEFWIGSKSPNFFNFNSSNKNKYSNPIYKEEYEFDSTNSHRG